MDVLFVDPFIRLKGMFYFMDVLNQ